MRYHLFRKELGNKNKDKPTTTKQKKETNKTKDSGKTPLDADFTSETPKMGHPLRWALGTLKTIAACQLIYTYGYSVGATCGPSMLPTIETWGEYVLVSRRHRLGRNVQVGDLVVYTVPI